MQQLRNRRKTCALAHAGEQHAQRRSHGGENQQSAHADLSEDAVAHQKERNLCRSREEICHADQAGTRAHALHVERKIGVKVRAANVLRDAKKRHEHQRLVFKQAHHRNLFALAMLMPLHLRQEEGGDQSHPQEQRSEERRKPIIIRHHKADHRCRDGISHRAAHAHRSKAETAFFQRFQRHGREQRRNAVVKERIGAHHSHRRPDGIDKPGSHQH